MAANRISRALWRENSLPQIVDKLAGENVYGIWPVDHTSYLAGVRTITYADLANIVNGLAWWLVKHHGSQSGSILAYLGPNDVRFMAIVLATMKTGNGLFLSSPRNSPEAHRKLFDMLQVQALVTADPTSAFTQTVLESVKPCKLIGIPSIDELLSTSHPVYPSEKSLHDSRSEILWVIHTSGSTGFPKPLVWTWEAAAKHIEAGSRESDGLISVDSRLHGKRVLSTLPPFHGAGLVQFQLYAIPFGNIVTIPATTGAIVTAHGIVEALKQTPVDMVIMVPSVVVELAQNPELLDYCAKHLELILYIGGDLPQSLGDSVAAKVPLRCWWGASEVGMPQQMIVPELDHHQGGWRYIRFHPCAGAVFDEVDEGIYELVIRRDKKCFNTQPTFTIQSFKDLEEYRTRDLFEKHPVVPDAWCWRARADDIIVFLNGEKTNPVFMEQCVVARSPNVVAGALVIGSQRFQAALLIEPVANTYLSTAEQAALIERVWPNIEEANQIAPAHARVEKSLILIATPHPFIRASKGTVKRSASIAQYATEIDSLYANAETALDVDADGGEMPDAHRIDFTKLQIIERAIRSSVASITGWPGADTEYSFFDRGMDSLQALRLVRALRKTLHRPGLSLSAIYQNPTTAQLATALTTDTDAASSDEQGIARQLLATYRKLIQQLPKPEAVSASSSVDQTELVHILLTGSTGTLGTSILFALLSRPGIGHVFCLNRAGDGGFAAQHKRFATVGLDPALLSSRVTFLHADLAAPELGLETNTYDELRSRVALVIHNAWPVNFNLALLAFRPQLAGLVNLFKFATPPGNAIRTVFISSVSAVVGVGTAAAEETVPDSSSLEAVLGNGYARSKLLAELLCDAAARRLGLPVDILRVGQIGGSTTQGGAVWNRAEWLPSLIISSLMHLRCLPKDLGPVFSEVDWVPSDLLGAVVTDLALLGADASRSEGAEVYNIRNPRTTMWSKLVPSIQAEARAELDYVPQVVSSTTWLTRLQESEGSGDGNAEEDVARNPAVKLLDLYRGLWPKEGQAVIIQKAPMVVSRSVTASSTLRDMSSVSPEWTRKWVKEWIR
ncbi:hypothetical protein F4819DRAFT_494891 [Hypoxylon fuscum]|nr:hypothetical protein F4819DRAFT_494891 [Hypoxylon fuscum]